MMSNSWTASRTQFPHTTSILTTTYTLLNLLGLLPVAIEPLPSWQTGKLNFYTVVLMNHCVGICWYCGNCSTGRIVIQNCVLWANCGNSTLAACLACAEYMTYPSLLYITFSNANICSWKFIPFLQASCLELLLNDKAFAIRHWNSAFM